MKSLKPRNKSPVHYKYTWQRCANQSYLFAEGYGRRGGLAGSAQHLLSSVTQFGQRSASPARDAPTHTRTHAGRQLWHREDTRTYCGTADGALAASTRPTGVYQVENVPGILQTDLCGQTPERTGSPDGTYMPGSGCKTELRGNRQLRSWILFFLKQLFNFPLGTGEQMPRLISA